MAAARDAYGDRDSDMDIGNASDDMSFYDDDETETDEDIGRPWFRDNNDNEDGGRSIDIEEPRFSDFEDNEDGANFSEDNDEWYMGDFSDFKKEGRSIGRADVRRSEIIRYSIYYDRPYGFRYYGNLEFGSGSRGDSTCPITMSSLKNPVITQCGHMFSLESIVLTMRVRALCPSCNTEIKRDSYVLEGIRYYSVVLYWARPKRPEVDPLIDKDTGDIVYNELQTRLRF